VLEFAKKILTAEVTRRLDPYPDWSRPGPGTVQNESALVRELLSFLADPAEEIHRFSKPVGERTMLEDYIRRHSLDLDCTTITTGRPHTLSCRKNSNSHLRALELRARDEELLAKLEG